MGFLDFSRMQIAGGRIRVCKACHDGEHQSCVRRQARPCACHDEACMAQGQAGRTAIQQQLFNVKGGR